MNWLDMIIIFILLSYILKGFKFGLISSIFNIIIVILSIMVTDWCYPIVYDYIIKTPFLSEIFENITDFIINILFHTGIDENVNLIPNLISDKLTEIITTFLLILIIFSLVNSLLRSIFRSLSFRVNVPILKQLNKAGGIIFGLIEGVFVLYLLSFVLSPIALLFPESLIGRGVNDSLILTYILSNFNIFDLKFNISPKNYL